MFIKNTSRLLQDYNDWKTVYDHVLNLNTKYEKLLKLFLRQEKHLVELEKENKELNKQLEFLKGPASKTKVSDRPGADWKSTRRILQARERAARENRSAK